MAEFLNTCTRNTLFLPVEILGWLYKKHMFLRPNGAYAFYWIYWMGSRGETFLASSVEYDTKQNNLLMFHWWYFHQFIVNFSKCSTVSSTCNDRIRGVRMKHKQRWMTPKKSHWLQIFRKSFTHSMSSLLIGLYLNRKQSTLNKMKDYTLWCEIEWNWSISVWIRQKRWL